jgi:hypothetical protein
MANADARLQALKDGVRAEARQRYARWDDGVFERAVSWQAGHLWRALEKHPAKVRERSVLAYLNVVASGIGAGYVTFHERAPRTLMEAVCTLMPNWFASTRPAHHAKIAATAWNLADGAHREAAWMEQYLLARVSELDDPMALEEKALKLLKPILEPQRTASWKGPFSVIVVDLARRVSNFLPGEISMIAPGLLRVGDRRNRTSIGVLLARGGAKCIGRMDVAPPTAAPMVTPDVAVTWTHDRVTVTGTTVALPLMACTPLHTLALPNGYLVAVLENSQSLWVVETP